MKKEIEEMLRKWILRCEKWGTGWLEAIWEGWVI